MKYIKATLEFTEQIYELVQDTIKTIYSKYYPKQVVDFFCELHRKENIVKDIEGGCVGIFLNDNEIVGTGSYKDNHITRVYVAPDCQGKGYGSYIMNCLENEISKHYEVACLDSSLPASSLYEHRGYMTVKHEKYILDNEVVLVYEIMEKQLRKENNNVTAK